MAALVKQLLHICIAVPDADEALRFYRDVLGFESVFYTDNEKADGHLLGFERDDIGLKAHHILTVGAPAEQATEINLVEFTDPRTITEDGPYSEMNHVGLNRLALLVEDVDEAFTRVGSHGGVEIVCAPKDIVIRESETTHSSRWFSFRDPFGVFITITEPPEPQAGGDSHG